MKYHYNAGQIQQDMSEELKLLTRMPMTVSEDALRVPPFSCFKIGGPGTYVTGSTYLAGGEAARLDFSLVQALATAQVHPDDLEYLTSTNIQGTHPALEHHRFQFTSLLEAGQLILYAAAVPFGLTHGLHTTTVTETVIKAYFPHHEPYFKASAHRLRWQYLKHLNYRASLISEAVLCLHGLQAVPQGSFKTMAEYCIEDFMKRPVLPEEVTVVPTTVPAAVQEPSFTYPPAQQESSSISTREYSPLAESYHSRSRSSSTSLDTDCRPIAKVRSISPVPTRRTERKSRNLQDSRRYRSPPRRRSFSPPGYRRPCHFKDTYRPRRHY